MSASFFWSPFETEIADYSDLVGTIERVLEKAKRQNRQFVWRGQVNADWPLHSSLYRRLSLTTGGNPIEDQLSRKEKEVLTRLQSWGLHNIQGRGRLSVLNQLAMLQHFGAPTRLIDVSFNAWVGVFFAVEEKWSNGAHVNEDIDARLFAIDVTERIINGQSTLRGWEDLHVRPWRSEDRIPAREWTTSFYAWKPPSLDARISAQNGGFLFGGVPGSVTATNSRFQFPRSPVNNEGFWRINEARGATCIALRPHKFAATAGAIPASACYTFKIAAGAKANIRKRLELMFGYKHSTIYPDYTGFSDFALPELKRW